MSSDSSTTNNPPPFTFDDTLRQWDTPAKAWLETNNKTKEWDGLASATAVFNPSGQVLLIQRAAHDSMPNKWELPGGAVDDTDPTVLHGAARELFEEAGLIAGHFTNVISRGVGQHPGDAFQNSTKTKTWCRFAFAVDVDDCSAVKLDPNEHQDFVWVGEKEVRDQRDSGGRGIPITRETMAGLILEAFRLRKERIGID